MLNLDPAKLLVIAVVAIILLGPDRLPQVARQVGAAWRSFNEFRHRMEAEVRDTMPDLPPTHEIARLARSPSALLNRLSAMSEGDESETEGKGKGNGNANGNGSGAGGSVEAEAGSAPGPEAEAGGGPGSNGDSSSLPAQGVTPDGVARGPELVADGAEPGPVGPVAGGPAPWTPSAAPTPSTAPEVITPGDPTLN
jgi:sec-independent protein translocase protein TatB